MAKYKMIGEEFGEVYVDVKITKTYLTIKAISPKPLTWACIDPVWEEKGLKARLDNMCRHCVKLGADDGFIVIYPDRMGIPYVLQEVVDDRNQ